MFWVNPLKVHGRIEWSLNMEPSKIIVTKLVKPKREPLGEAFGPTRDPVPWDKVNEIKTKLGHLDMRDPTVEQQIYVETIGVSRMDESLAEEYDQWIKTAEIRHATKFYSEYSLSAIRKPMGRWQAPQFKDMPLVVNRRPHKPIAKKFTDTYVTYIIW